MPILKTRTARRELQARRSAEIEAGQAGLRRSIIEAERLVGESDEMLRRHREECDQADARRAPTAKD